MKFEKKIRETLFNAYSNLGGAFAGGVGKGDEDTSKESGLDDGAFYPYVNIEF